MVQSHKLGKRGKKNKKTKKKNYQKSGPTECLKVVIQSERAYLSRNSLNSKCPKIPRKFWNQSINTFSATVCKLTSISDRIGNFRNLTQLDLRFNSIHFLPEELGRCFMLRICNLAHNSLRSLPESFWKLIHLRHLNIANNRFSRLSEGIGQLTSLEEFIAHDNLLKTIPDEFGKLEKLNRLFLQKNNLEKLPASIGNLSNLVRLHLDYNRLTNLPEECGNLSKLEELDIFGNYLISFPISLRNCSLTFLCCCSNPFLISLQPLFQNRYDDHRQFPGRYNDQKQVAYFFEILQEYNKKRFMVCYFAALNCSGPILQAIHLHYPIPKQREKMNQRQVVKRIISYFLLCMFGLCIWRIL